MKPIIWTRALDDWASDRQLFADHGVQHVPCLSFARLPFTFPDNWREFTKVVTSPRMVRMLSEDERDKLRGGPAVLTFGEKTAVSLRAAGIACEVIPAGGGEAFTQSLLARDEGNVAVLTNDDPAFAIAKTLVAAGRRAETWTIYKTMSAIYEQTGEEMDAQNQKEMATTLTGVVCFASPSAVRGFARLREFDSMLATRVSAIVIGGTTAAACEGVFEYERCGSSTLESLWQAALKKANA